MGRKLLLILPALALLLFLSGTVAQAQGPENGLAEQVLPAGSFKDGSLSVRLVSPTHYAFSDPTSSQNLTFDVTNPTDSKVAVYLAVYRDGQWNVLDRIGSVEPGRSAMLEYPVKFKYAGQATETDRFGIIGETASGYVGKTFSVTEDWTEYENTLRSSLSVVGMFIAVVMLAVLLIVMAGVIAVAAATTHEEVDKGEYTWWTLFFPLMKARPLAEKIANILVHPFFWGMELFLGAILILFVFIIAIATLPSDIGLLVFVIGGVAAIFMPVIFLVICWVSDYYEREPFRFLIAMFMWGILATFISFFLNTTLDLFGSLLLGSGIATLITAVVVAPVVEETAKGLGLLIVSGHHEFDDTFDGILYGFAVGMGFAVVENWLYFAANANPVSVEGLGPWAFNILYRSILCSLAHGCFTAATGGAIGFLKSRRSLRSFGFAGFFLGLPIAIVMHGTFNFMAIIDAIMQSVVGFPVPVFDPVLTLIVTGMYIILGAVLQLRLGEKLKQSLRPGG
ncbi:PrsW family intramembrane metalloprotease [Methanocella arvoryzae]|nr:PrsW family intramembrane metalloprotease [Methanocella arvoryzae]